MHRLKERLTFANVTASLALFIALGGTSYAAITLPRNSVGTNQLRTGAIRSVDVKDRSMEARDLSAAARRFLKGQKGERGERGPQGPAGDAGQAGTTTTTGGTTSSGVTITIKPQSGSVGPKTDENVPATGQATATCDAGRVTGGGVNLVNNVETTVHDSYPVGTTQWRATVANDTTQSQGFTVYAICAT